MPPSGNRRRPRSGAPKRPDLREKAEKIHSEIFGHEAENQPRKKTDRWWVRPLAGFGLAVFCWIMSKVFNSEYLLMFALSLAVGIVLMVLFRLVAVRRSNK